VTTGQTQTEPQQERGQSRDFKIVVAGDVIAEARLAKSKVRPPAHHVTLFETAAYLEPYWQHVGATTIAEIIKRALAGIPSLSQRDERPYVISPTGWGLKVAKNNEDDIRTDPRFWGSYLVCAQFPKESGGDRGVAWRIEQTIGYERSSPTAELDNLSPDDSGDADLVVVNQSLGDEEKRRGFMAHEGAWPASLCKPTSSPWLVIEWSRPRVDSKNTKFWEMLVTRFSRRIIVVVTAEDLRAAGVRISRGLSWERTLTHLFEKIHELWECEPGQRPGPLCGCAQLVVSLGTSGAAVFTGPTGKMRAQLIYDPRFLEDGWDERFEGAMNGVTSCLTAGIALEVVRAGKSFTGLDGSGARAGVIAARCAVRTGFWPVGHMQSSDTELPGDLRFPSSFAARALRSVLAKRSVIGVIDAAASRLRTELSRPGASDTKERLTQLVGEYLAELEGTARFDRAAVLEEIERIYDDWTECDPAGTDREHLLASLPPANGSPASERSTLKVIAEHAKLAAQHKGRLIERIMLFLAPDDAAISEAESLQDVEIVETEDWRSRLPGWSILEEKLPRGRDDTAPAAKIVQQCRTLVESGDGTSLPFPTMRIGRLLLTSRDELESLTIVRELMEDYIRGVEQAPLSIAVFGPPGAGKSFAIKQLAKNIPPCRYTNVETLTFNLSQFSTPEALAVALQQVRDLGLSGMMPLVFWDEFDTRFEGMIGWPRYFLAPMQDGKYQDGSAIYYIGRAIFVFAGGTSGTFGDFITKQQEANGEWKATAIEQKLPDFVSRLKGFMDVAPIEYQAADGGHVVIDAATALRRAKLLRAILEESGADLDETIPAEPGARRTELRKRFNVDPGVMAAFLRVPSFKYGVRSMEAIVKMSGLTGKNRYDRSSLPPEKQLDMHVDAKAFLEIANGDWADCALSEPER
jgi:hypothetical protein